MAGMILSSVLTVACMVSFLFLPIAGAYFWLRHERKKWRQAAEQLGLTFQPSLIYDNRWAPFGLGPPYYLDDMVGERGGFPVRVGVRVVSTSPKRNSRTYYTYAKVDYGRSLGLGLNIRPRNLATRVLDSIMGSLIDGKDIEIGDPEVDPYYAIHAADEVVVRRLLTVPYLHEALRGMRDVVFRPHIDDDSLRCECRGKSFDPGTLAMAIDSAIDLARRVVAARQELGATSAEQVVSTAWRQVAQAHGLELDLENTRMSGRFEGMHIEVDTRLQGGRRWTVFTVRFDRPLGVDLRLTRQGALSVLSKLIGAQDVEVGDPLFDKRFVVKGAPEDAVRALLSPEVRSRLIDLQAQASNLEVTDDRLSAHVAWLVADAVFLESSIAALTRTAAAMAQVSAHVPGPYRA